MKCIMAAIAGTVTLGLAACNAEGENAAATGDNAAAGTVEWTAAGVNQTYSVSGGYAMPVSAGLHRIMIEANPPEGAPTRHGPALSMTFSLIGTGTASARTAVIAYDPRGPGTGWWARQGRGPGTVEFAIDEFSLEADTLSLTGRIEGELEPRGDQDPLTINARFDTELKVME